jgi:FkbM family methyltransferase
MNLRRVQRIRGHTFLEQALPPGAVVVDLGANRGDFSAELVNRFGCTAYAVEPVQEMYQRIPQSTSLTAYLAAMGGADGIANIFLFGGLGSSVRGDFAPQLGDHQESVEQLTLGSLFARAGIRRVDLMKVDIEGAEIEMFESASDEQLRGIAQLTVEFHDFIYPELVAPVESIKRRLCGLGFAMIRFSVTNADVLFVNRIRLPLSALDEAHLRWVVRYRDGLIRRAKRYLPSGRQLHADE